MKLSLQQAGDAVGVSKSTIYRAVKSGKLSATRNEDGDYQVDPSELHRVFEVKQEAEQGAAVSQSEARQAPADDAMLEWLRELADEQREVIARRDAEIQALRDQVDAERDKADQLQTKLLEAPRNQLNELKQQVEELAEQRQVGFWQRVFAK